jgi:hypothetical protein
MKTYYILQLDNYNQPNGLIDEIELTEKEFDQIKKTYIYIYDSYFQACERAVN